MSLTEETSWESRRDVTFRRERGRAVASGVLESASTTFVLLIAVQYFDCGQAVKGLIAGGGSFGLLLSPALVSFVEKRRIPVGRAASRIFGVGAVAFGAIAVAPIPVVFVVGALVGLSSSTLVIPLMTQIYSQNYPTISRGRLFSSTVVVRIFSVMVFSALAGWGLDRNIEWARWLFLVFSLSCLASAALIYRIPTSPLGDTGLDHPFRALRFAREDAVFRRTLISWMFMGVGNLMMFPLRVEYLSNPIYGIAASEVTVALVVGAAPAAVRLGMSRVWGNFFDRIDFFVFRLGLNLFFIAGILFYFSTKSLVFVVMGSLFYGVALAGGEVAWNLWVTKLAPEGRVAEYMSVHTFFTGLRGLLAPLVSFQLLGLMGSRGLGALAVGLIVLACWFLMPLVGVKTQSSGARS